MGYKMRKIVFTKIVLIIFLGSFQNILSQSKKIDEINQSISYWENDYSYKDYISSNDRSICQSSLGYRGIIRGFTKIGVRKYDVLFFNVVNSEYGRVTIDYSDKPVPSEDEYKDYITNQINSLKNDIENENERLLVIEKRRLANIEFQKKQKVYIEKEQYNLRIRLDSILNEIQGHVENTNSYYNIFKSLDSLFQKDYDFFQIKKDSLFELPIKYIEEIFGESYDYEAFNVLPFYQNDDYNIEDHLSYGLRGRLDRNDNGIRQINLRDTPSINTLLKISDIYYMLNSDGLGEEYLKIGEAIKRYLLFFNFIDTNRWVGLINNNLNFFKYESVDTLGFKQTGKFKWLNKNNGEVNKFSVISDLFYSYESELIEIEKKGLDYKDSKYINDFPQEHILREIYLQFGKIKGLFDYSNDLGYLNFESQEDFYSEKLIKDLSILSNLRERINIIKEFDKFIIEDLKPLFEEVRNGKDLIPVKHKIYKKIHNEIIENLSEKEKVIHYSLVGDYVDYSLNSEVKFFYSLLHYGHRNKEYRSGSVSNISGRYSEFSPETFKFKNLKEFFVFIDNNNINHDDLMAYINKTRKIISNYK